MKVYYLGSIYPKPLLEELCSRRAKVDTAANTFQYALLSGLQMYFPKLQVFSFPSILSWPKTQYARVPSMTFYINDNSDQVETNVPVKQIGYLNFPFVKMISKFLKLILTYFKELRDKDNVLLIYALHSPFLFASTIFRRKFSKICVIVPDLPEYMSSNTSIIYRLAKKVDISVINFCLRYVDSFVLLTPYMLQKIHVNTRPYQIIEGIYEPSDIHKISVDKENHKTILYSGIISSRYGVFDLINAFTLISDPTYRLWLCGSCTELDKLEKCLQADTRINYMGILSKDEVRILQKRATLLVNPRHSNEEYTLFSFPSKTMEYMASGTPTLMSRLGAIPVEYYEYLFFFDDESVQGISSKIQEVCNMDESVLQLKGKLASDFILSNKTSSIQAKKIVNLLR